MIIRKATLACSRRCLKDMDRDEAYGWLSMCGWDTLAANVTTRAATPTAACHVIQGFIDRCAELDHVYSDWRITTRCCECLDCSHVMHSFDQFVRTNNYALNVHTRYCPCDPCFDMSK